MLRLVKSAKNCIANQALKDESLIQIKKEEPKLYQRWKIKRKVDLRIGRDTLLFAETKHGYG